MTNDPSKDLTSKPKKRRGRPPGSKNAPAKVKSPMETAMAPAATPKAKKSTNPQCCGKDGENHGSVGGGKSSFRCVVCGTWWEAKE